MRIAVVLLLITALLAGCTQSSDGPDALNDPATADQELGELRVVVVDPDLAPIAHANVTVAGRNGTTDAAGSASFEVPAGFHEIHATKDGYRAARAGADVAAGATQETQIKLLPQSGSTPHPDGGESGSERPGHGDHSGRSAYREPFHMEGFFDCSATYLIITGDCLLLLDNVTEQAGIPVQPGNATDEKYVLEFPLDLDWRTVVAEMYWDETTLAGEKMTFAVEPADAPEDSHAPKYARAEGANPLRIQLEPGAAHENASASADGEEPDMPNPHGGEVLRTRSFVQGELHRPGGTEFLGVGAAVQQRFDVFVTVFYGEPAPDGWSHETG